MIRYIKNEPYENKAVGGACQINYMVEIACHSTDTKPTENIVTGSICLEADTGKIYAFDESTGDWEEIGSSGGGGGGGSSDHFICTVDAETDALDKTWQEITDALGDNKTVIAILNTYAWVVAGTSSDPEFGAYYVAVFNNGQATDFFYAESADDYPVLD